jgi:hypothetical protein
MIFVAPPGGAVKLLSIIGIRLSDLRLFARCFIEPLDDFIG